MLLPVKMFAASLHLLGVTGGEGLFRAQSHRMAFTWLVVRRGDGISAVEPGLIPAHLVEREVSHPASQPLPTGWAGRMSIGCRTYMPGEVEYNSMLPWRRAHLLSPRLSSMPRNGGPRRAE
jgi:hypothetical protein